MLQNRYMRCLLLRSFLRYVLEQSTERLWCLKRSQGFGAESMFKLPGFSRIQTFDFFFFFWKKIQIQPSSMIFSIFYISKEELGKGKPQGFQHILWWLWVSARHRGIFEKRSVSRSLLLDTHTSLSAMTSTLTPGQCSWSHKSQRKCIPPSNKWSYNIDLDMSYGIDI